jgi:hypothetical protein
MDTRMPIFTTFFNHREDPSSYKRMFKRVQKEVAGIESRGHVMINNSSLTAQDKIIREVMGVYASRTNNVLCFHGGRHHTKEVRDLLGKEHVSWTVESFMIHLARKIPKDKLNPTGSLVKRLIFVARACYQIEELGIDRDPQKFVNITWDKFAAKLPPFEVDNPQITERPFTLAQ